MNIGYFFPGFVRKTVSFTMDDGTVVYDRRFINTVKPYGIVGAFNIPGGAKQGDMSDDEYREFYRGYEITNHCKMHPKVRRYRKRLSTIFVSTTVSRCRTPFFRRCLAIMNTT